MVAVLSCVPQQLSDFDQKLDWLVDAAKRFKPDLFITPQEFFGGVVMMRDDPWITRDRLLPRLSQLCSKLRMALVVGVCEQFNGQKREALWFINHEGELVGTQYKFALPRYDDIRARGGGQLVPELDFTQRFKTFELAGLEVAGVFCWEVYSDFLWAGLSLQEPDLVASCIKFGPNAWPTVRKGDKGLLWVTGFGYGSWAEEGGWLERLRVASLWEVRCPVTSSTNSWNLRPISMPICGTITGLPGQGANSLWHPRKEDKMKEIPENFTVDEISANKVRAVRKSKFAYRDAVGELPPMALMKHTMLLKMARIERRIIAEKQPFVVGQFHKEFDDVQSDKNV